MNKNLLLSYIILAILSFSLRLWRIDYLPSVISHDEIFYITQAKTLATNGRGANGEWKATSLKPEVELYAELPGVIMTPAAKLFPNHPIRAAKATSVLLGTLLIFSIAALAYELSKNHRLAFITAVLASFNPWMFQFSRMGFDSLFSLFFYITGLLLLIRNKSWKKLWSLPLLLLGFFQYQGLKVIFLPIILITTFYNIFKTERSINKLKDTWKKYLPSLIVLLTSLLVFSLYMFRVETQTAGNRLNFLIFNDHEYIRERLGYKFQHSLESPISKLYPNKITTIGERFVEQYFNSIDLNHLFVGLDVVRNPFAVYQHGLFYYIDFILILIGIFVIAKNKNKPASFLLIGLLLVAPLPSAIVSTDSWMVFRASFLMPIGIILIGFAINYLYEKLPKAVYYFVIAVYLLLISRFMYEYFNAYPITGTRDQYFSEKLIAKYIDRNPDTKFIVSSPEPIFVFQQIIINNNLINKESIDSINLSFQTEDYVLNNLSVVGERCIPSDIPEDTVYISHRNNTLCNNEEFSPSNHIKIPSLIDGGGVYRIFNDSICSKYIIDRYVRITENIFDIDLLNDQQFCQSLFIRN